MIGVFDSGFGGLCILAGMLKALPEHDFLYLGDSRRNPYGARSAGTIYEWSRGSVDWMFAQGCELIILACHTASNSALRRLQQEYLPASPYSNRRILGVTIPLVEEASRSARKRVGVLATRASCQSGSFETEIAKRNPDLKVICHAAPVLVSMIEEGMQKSPEARRILRKVLAPLKMASVDTLILGCTHFPAMEEDFRRKAGKKIRVISSSRVVGASLQDYLMRHPQIDQKIGKNRQCVFYTTEDASRFEEYGKGFLGRSFQASSVRL